VRAISLLLLLGLVPLVGCSRDPGPTAEAQPPSQLPPGLFLMDLVPETGFGLYAVGGTSKATMSGGVFRLSGDRLALLSDDMVFAHNIERFSEGYIATDTDRPFAAILDRRGATVRRIERLVWLDGTDEPLLGCNWLKPAARSEVARFLGVSPSGRPHLLVCKARPGRGEGMWWALCSLEDDTLRSLWEMPAARKAHAALLHDGVFYGAASAARTLVVRGRERELTLPLGDIRYMEVDAGRLWMAGDGFVAVLDQLPPAADATARTFCSGIGRAQAVHVWRDRVYVTANGTLLVYDLEGRLQRTVGQAPPPPGQSWLHDGLRALGYVQ